MAGPGSEGVRGCAPNVPEQFAGVLLFFCFHDIFIICQNIGIYVVPTGRQGVCILNRLERREYEKDSINR